MTVGNQPRDEKTTLSPGSARAWRDVRGRYQRVRSHRRSAAMTLAQRAGVEPMTLSAYARRSFSGEEIGCVRSCLIAGGPGRPS